MKKEHLVIFGIIVAIAAFAYYEYTKGAFLRTYTNPQLTLIAPPMPAGVNTGQIGNIEQNITQLSSQASARTP